MKENEYELRLILQETNINYTWFMVLLVWSILGLYVYNELLPIRNTLTKLVYLAVTFYIVSKNVSAISPFLRNPFKAIKTRWPVGNVLWVYPFSILLLSVLILFFGSFFNIRTEDAQNLSALSYTFKAYMGHMVTTPVSVLAEELSNLLILVTVASYLRTKLKVGLMPLTVLMVSIYFGAIHISAWGLAAAVNRMLIHFTFLFSVLVFRNVWPCILAHLYQNWMTHTAVFVEGFSALFVTYGLILLLIIIIYRKISVKYHYLG